MNVKALLCLMLLLVGSALGLGQTSADPHYEVTYSGGEAECSGYGGYMYSTPVSYSSSISSVATSQSYQARAKLETFAPSSQERIESAYARGPLKATFQWIAGPRNELPPPFVILTETISVQAYGTSSQVDCGLPNPSTG